MWRSLVSGLIAVVCASGIARAANIEVSTTRLAMSADSPIAAMNIRNASEQQVALQAMVVRWSQKNGEDVFEPTRDILVNPPIFKLAPNATQIARLGLQAKSIDSEQSYRLFLQEIPEANRAQQNLTTILRISIPIFITGQNSKPLLDSHLYVDPTGSAWIEFINRGNGHVQVTSISLSDGGGNGPVDIPTSTYVLPGQTRRLALPDISLRKGQTVAIELSSDLEQALPPIQVQVSDGPTVLP